jgi:hypothetical protein
MLSACACCLGVKAARLPPTRPSSRARAKPKRVLSRIISLSNSAKLPKTCVSIRPTGVVVSIASVKLRKPAPISSNRLIICSRSESERVSRGLFEQPESENLISDRLSFASCSDTNREIHRKEKTLLTKYTEWRFLITKRVCFRS